MTTIYYPGGKNKQITKYKLYYDPIYFKLCVNTKDTLENFFSKRFACDSFWVVGFQDIYIFYAKYNLNVLKITYFNSHKNVVFI